MATRQRHARRDAVDLVKLMETHPTAGLIQLCLPWSSAESLFGRIQQFANPFTAPIFIAGLIIGHSIGEIIGDTTPLFARSQFMQ